MQHSITLVQAPPRDGSVEEYLTRDRGVAGLSLTVVNESILEPRKTHPYITEKMLTALKHSLISKTVIMLTIP